MKSPTTNILQGIGYGALLGGGVAALGYFMRKNKLQGAAELGYATTHVQNDPNLVSILEKLTPLAACSPRGRQLYEACLGACDLLLRAESNKAKGNEQFKATRAAGLAHSSAKALTKEAAKYPRLADRAYEAQADLQEMQTLLSNHLHNVMIS